MLPPPTSSAPLVVLDDDPTGTQLVHDVPVALRIDRRTLAAAHASGHGVMHVLTNARAHPPADAYRLVYRAAAASLEVAPHAQLVARGDSTLRGHVWEEYRAIRDAGSGGGWPPLLLVPALPSAGRVTVGGTHLLERDGRRTPLSQTEYATDASFGYSSARLLDWLEERSRGAFEAGSGLEISLARLRSDGPAAVSAALVALAAKRAPAACVPDAETHDDLRAVVEGLHAAQDAGVAVAVRCAPAFAALLAGRYATSFVDLPRPERGLMVVAGSYVPASQRQLASLRAAYERAFIELDTSRVLAGSGEEVRVAAAARALLRRTGIAIVATPSLPDGRLESLDVGARVAAALAAVVGAVHAAGGADVFVLKGGITSAVCARDGLDLSHALVRGPVEPGIALWEGDGTRRCLIVPGNVGDDEVLLRLVNGVLGR